MEPVLSLNFIIFSIFKMVKTLVPSAPIAPSPGPTTTTMANAPPIDNAVAQIAVCDPRPSRKRMPAPILEYNMKSKQFMEYNCYYLQKPIVMIFEEPVLLVKCNNNADGGEVVRVGVKNLDGEDRRTLVKHTSEMISSFPKGTKSLKPLFPTEVGEHPGMMFAKADNKSCTLYNSKGQKLDIMKDLPKVSECKIALMLLGMKTKDQELSFMMRIHQIMIKKVTDNEMTSELLFEVSDSGSSSSEDDE